MKKPQSKWFYAFAGVAVALIVAIVAVIILGTRPNDAGSNNLPPEQTPTVPADGPETGVYYYDVANGEILFSLNSGNKFTIAGPDINKSGDYTVSGDSIALDFVRDEDGTASAKYNGDTVTLTYKDATMTFLKKVYYTVSFNTAEGTVIDPVKILNGKTVANPGAPLKENNVFLGWYADADLTTPFEFNSAAITSDVTVYARWAEKVVGRKDFTAKLDLNYEGAPEAAELISVSGKLYDVPTPKREGYTFEGWYVSMYEDGSKLSFAYTEDMILDANTTLYAVWSDDASEKIDAPLASVTDSSIKWDAVDGASRYEIKILDAAGNTVRNESVGTTTYTFDFASAPAGDYTVEITAIASTAEKNSEVTVRGFKNKALPRVNTFQIVDGVLIFGAVEGAEKYYVTVDCGNDSHNHTLFDNGSVTTFNFSNCPMQKGGIKFTVTASANGYADSVSETFVFDRTLSAVTNVTYVPESDSFVWNAVDFAAGYKVTITAGNSTYTFDNGNKTSFSAALYTGEIKIDVTPVTNGYNSPDAATATYTKTAPAAPSDLVLNGSVLTWGAIEGATYEIKINGKTFTSDTNSFDLMSASLNANAVYEASVKAIKGGVSSSYSETVDVAYLIMSPALKYSGNNVYWDPVIGASNFEVRVNGGPVKTVSGANNAKVILTKEGINKIEVRYTDNGGSEWVAIEVNAYAVTYMSRSMSGEKTEYVAIGDTLTPPTDFINNGYSFSGWYNTPSTSAGNGIKYESFLFEGNSATVLYADWTPNSYKVELKVDGFDVNNIATGDKVDATYTQNYTLPVPVSTNPTYETFVGWFTGPSGSGTRLTDEKGNSVTAFPYYRDTEAYPYFNANILSFELSADGSYYSVKPGINFNTVSHVTIPYTYQDIPVTTIVENAFKGRQNLVTLNIPNTIKVVGVGAFTSTGKLESINVYEVEGNHTVYYSSHDGALLRHDMGGATTYLEAFPRAKTGTYVMPDNVDIIRNKALQYASISKIVISKSVTVIQDNAFYACQNLTTVEFEGGRKNSVSLAENMFNRTTGITSIKFPANISDINISILQNLPNLTSIEVEEGGRFYNSVNGMLTNSIGDKIIYAPNTISGVYTIPSSINYIGDGAFSGRNGITELVIPNTVLGIGQNAFESCAGLTKITFEGKRSEDINVGASAFANCKSLKTVIFGGSGSETDTNKGAISIGANAFKPYKALGAVNNSPSLQTVTFEDGTNVRSIGDYAFAEQKVLVNLTFGKNIILEQIGNYAFQNVVTLQTIEIPATTTLIGDGAFMGCTNATSVKFADGANEISFGASVFANCSKIEKIELPASTKSFNGSAFTGCSALSEVVISDSNPYLKAIDGVVYGIDANRNPVTLIFYPKTKSAAPEELAKLPWDTITAIGDSVFEGVSTLTEFNITSKITSIGANAFANCSKLTTVTCEPGAESFTLGAKAFYNCTTLTAAALPSTTTTISVSAFENCYKLATFSLPANVVEINANAFRVCQKITALEIPASVTYIGAGAFNNCTTLATLTFAAGAEITLDGNSLDKGPFSSCTALKTVDFNGRVKALPSYAFYLSGITTVDLSGVTTIADYALYNCKFTTLEIPNTVTYIGDRAFQQNTSLTSVTFEQGGTEPVDFGMLTFYGCNQLKSFTFPARTGKVYEYGNWSNQSTSGNPDSSQEFQTKSFFLTFYNCTMLENIYVEDGCKNFVSIDGILYETDADGKPSVLLYCPARNMGKDGTKEVIIPNTVVMVENLAFYYATQITKVTFEELPESDPDYGKPVLSIGNGLPDELANGSSVFNGSYIASVSFPSHLGTIGPGAVRLQKNGVTITFNEKTTGLVLSNNAFSSSRASTLTLYGVDYIGSSAFSQMSSLTSVSFVNATFETLPKTLFLNTAVTELKVPASVKTIALGAFSNANSLKKVSFEEGSKLTTIEGYIFQSNEYVNVSSPITDFDLTNVTKLREIGAYAFKGGANITSFTIPESVIAIGEHAFQNCTKLATLTLNSGITADMVMKNNHEGRISLLSDLTALATLQMTGEGKQLLVEDGVLYDKSKTIIYCFPAKKNATDYVIPSTVKTIEATAFKNFGGTVLVLPEGLEAIGERAFEAAKITDIVIPASLTEIGKNAFYNATATSLKFAPECKVTVIKAETFSNMRALKVLVLPDSVKIIEEKAFSTCNNIQELILPAALEEIGANAFNNIMWMTKLTFQQNVKFIGDYAFSGLIRLKSLELPASVEHIGISAFQNYGSYTNTDENGNEVDATIKFGEGSKLEIIGNNAFYNANKTRSLVLPEGLMTIGDNAFAAMSSLNSVSMADSVTAIGTGAFQNCTALTEAKLPANLEEIPADLFMNDAKLEKADLPEKVTAIGTNAFYGTAIKSITISKLVVTLGDGAFQNCTALETVVFDADNRLTVIGNNTFKNTSALVSVTLPKELETIGDNAFENSNVTNITLPSSLKTIGDYAFANCDNVEAFTVYGNVSHIGNYAFYDCDKLTVAALSFGVEYIGDFAFRSCDKLTEAYIPATVSELGANPFFECELIKEISVDAENTVFVTDANGAIYNEDNTVLYYYPETATQENITLPLTLSEIKMGAFINNAYIKTISIPINVAKIEAYTFMNCQNLETVTIEAGSIINEIGESAFEGCAKLTTLAIPANVQKIGDRAFFGCATLDNIVIPNTARSLGNYVFANCTSLENVSFTPAMTQAQAYTIGTHFFENCEKITSLILPNHYNISAEDAAATGVSGMKTNAAIPSYMFAGTGISGTVMIPTKITILDTHGVFMNCKNITAVEFGMQTYTYNKIGDHFFDGCEKLTEVTLPKGATGTTLGNYAFANCTALRMATLYYKTEPTSGGDYMFYNCKNLESVVWMKVGSGGGFVIGGGGLGGIGIGGGGSSAPTVAYMKYIAPYFFAGCTSLQSFTVETNATISKGAFEGCTALNAFNINGSFKTISAIGDNAFKGCTGFTTFALNFALPTNVGKGVFEGWTAEQTIKLTMNPKTSITAQIANGVFDGCSAVILDQNNENVELG